MSCLRERGGGHEPLDVASSEVVQNRVYLPWSWYTGLPYREDRGGGGLNHRGSFIWGVYIQIATGVIIQWVSKSETTKELHN